MKTLKESTQVLDPKLLAALDSGLKAEVQQYIALKEQERKVKEDLAEQSALIESLWTDSSKTKKLDNIIITYVRSYETSSNSYANAFKLALSKVNAATKNVLNQCLEETKVLTKAKASFRIKEEGVMDKIKSSQVVQLIKGVFNKLKNLFNKRDQAIDSLFQISNKMKTESISSKDKQIIESIANPMGFKLKQVNKKQTNLYEFILENTDKQISVCFDDTLATKRPFITSRGKYESLQEAIKAVSKDTRGVLAEKFIAAIPKNIKEGVGPKQLGQKNITGWQTTDLPDSVKQDRETRALKLIDQLLE